jgi:hypothetical protein
MQRPPRVVELVFDSVDLFPQLVPLLSIAIPGLVGSLVLPAQPLNLAPLPFDFALLPFELLDQLFARGCAPRRSHACLMPRLGQRYKGKLRRSRRSDGGLERISR